MERDQSAIQLIGHTVSLGTLLSVIAGILPVIASVVALIWYVIQIFESDTWCRRVERRRRRRIAKLRAELIGLETLMLMSKLQQKRPVDDAGAGEDAGQ
jgi:uncharacterized membrane-anchored protein